SNSISISSSISNCYQISFALLSFRGENTTEVDNLLINNNTLSFTNSDIDLSTTPVYLVNTSTYSQNTNYSQNTIIHNTIAENNYVNFINATNVSFGLLFGFDSFSFALPNDIQNSDTILYLW
ncbi:MAG: hypothetical protein LBD57_01855, partial [Endomicrobium sp.]|uniref:hypothetical protein n=1 Tax=Candidatus Endomicrobiellum cubanum TaxID=3242325 RepID=UPI00281C1645|nr:hypothetical protein [Endomicrobium sp.]